MRYLLALFISFFILVPTVSAHTLRVSGQIGVTLHVHPDDEPISGVETPFYIDITDRNQTFTLVSCRCLLHITQGDNELAQMPIVGTTRPSFVFPSSGEYTIVIDGQPLGGASFPAFSTRFDYYVHPASGRSLSNYQTTTPPNYLRRSFPYVTLMVALSILCILLIPLDLTKGKQ